MQQCTGSHELTIGEDGNQYCGSTEISVTGVTLDGVEVTIDVADPILDQPLPEGAYVEVEITPISGLAVIGTDVGGSVMTVAVSDADSDEAWAASAIDARNTAEVAAIVSLRGGASIAGYGYRHASVQNRPRGQSDPAPGQSSWGTRAAAVQAIGRAIGGAVRSAIGTVRASVTIRVFYPSGQPMAEATAEGQISD